MDNRMETIDFSLMAARASRSCSLEQAKEEAVMPAVRCGVAEGIFDPDTLSHSAKLTEACQQCRQLVEQSRWLRDWPV